MTKKYRVHDLVKFNYSEIGEYIDENHTDRPLRNDVVVNLLNQLSEENEQLKQAIAETEKMVQSTYDELTKLRCFRKNILRIKHSWDYLMEAIQYD